MFAYLTGTVTEASGGIVVVEVNGIGYELNVSSASLADFSRKKEVKAYTYLQVKEDGVALYGFSTKEEKVMFERLISVSGVGCKGAIAVLSGIGLSDLALCIATGDSKKLTAVKGVGKKTAERIILELKEKIGLDFGRPEAEFPATASGGTGEPTVLDDAVMALAALGIPKSDALRCAERAMAAGAQSLEDILARALKNLY